MCNAPQQSFLNREYHFFTIDFSLMLNFEKPRISMLNQYLTFLILSIISTLVLYYLQRKFEFSSPDLSILPRQSFSELIVPSFCSRFFYGGKFEMPQSAVCSYYNMGILCALFQMQRFMPELNMIFHTVFVSDSFPHVA